MRERIGKREIEALALGALSERMGVARARHELRRLPRAGVALSAVFLRGAIGVIARGPDRLRGNSNAVGNDLLGLRPGAAQRDSERAVGVAVMPRQPNQARAPLPQRRYNVGRVPVRRGWFLWRVDSSHRDRADRIPHLGKNQPRLGLPGHGPVSEVMSPLKKEVSQYVNQRPYAERLRAERSRLGKKPRELAALAGLSKGGYIKYESGERRPGVEELAKLHQAGVDIMFVVTGRRGVSEPAAPYAALDTELMSFVLAGVEKELPDATTRERAAVAALAYRHLLTIPTKDVVALADFFRQWWQSKGEPLPFDPRSPEVLGKPRDPMNK